MKEQITMVPATEPNRWQQEQIERKLGMFVHFGINTFLNQEWSDGTAAATIYAPTAIDCDQWAKTAYEAGMNYIIVITKHHDGFCLWDTTTTEYGVNQSSNQTDVVAEAAKACKKYGLKLALYYSLWDRNCAFYGDDETYVNYMLSQLTELFDGRYGDIVELWFDGGWDKKNAQWGLDRIYDLVKRLQPQCQIGVNHTIGNHELKGGFASNKFLPENQELHDPIAMFPSDFRILDPHMTNKDNDPKLFTYHGDVYYMTFEATICSREYGENGMCWFYSDTYETNFKLCSYEKIVESYKQLIAQNNIMVINLPADKNGKLVQSDIDNLMLVSKELGIDRAVDC